MNWRRIALRVTGSIAHTSASKHRIRLKYIRIILLSLYVLSCALFTVSELKDGYPDLITMALFYAMATFIFILSRIGLNIADTIYRSLLYSMKYGRMHPYGRWRLTWTGVSYGIFCLLELILQNRTVIFAAVIGGLIVAMITR